MTLKEQVDKDIKDLGTDDLKGIIHNLMHRMQEVDDMIDHNAYQGNRIGFNKDK